MAEKITVVLKREHDEIRRLFKDIRKDDDKLSMTDRKLLFPELKALLLAHSEAEEKSLYGALEQEGELRHEVLEGREEHHVASLLLEELSTQSSLGDEQWMAKVEVLNELLEHHLEEEEEEMFSAVDKIFDKQQARELGSEYKQIRDEVMSDAPRSA